MTWCWVSLVCYCVVEAVLLIFFVLLHVWIWYCFLFHDIIVSMLQWLRSYFLNINIVSPLYAGQVDDTIIDMAKTLANLFLLLNLATTFLLWNLSNILFILSRNLELYRLENFLSLWQIIFISIYQHLIMLNCNFFICSKWNYICSVYLFLSY